MCTTFSGRQYVELSEYRTTINCFECGDKKPHLRPIGAQITHKMQKKQTSKVERRPKKT